MINVQIDIKNYDDGQLGQPWNSLDEHLTARVVMEESEEAFLSFCRNVWKRYHPNNSH